jgi:branched-chain amino acid transport system substrate-binding protein
MNRRDAIQRVGAATAALALPAWAQAQRIVLGQSAAFSGPASALGEQFKKGAQFYFDRVNARGGVNGRTIELQSLDDGYEPERCAANTRKLIDSGVFALFGYIGTPTSLAALPLATSAKVPFIAPFTGADALRLPFNRYAFHVRASYADETAEIVKQVTAVGIKRIGVFYQNDSYGKSGLDGVTRALAPLGLTPAGMGTVERNTVAVDAAVKSIVASRAEAIVQISAYKSCAAFIRAARLAGFGGTFYNVSFVGTQALADELKTDGAGVLISQVMPFPYTASLPITREFQAAAAKGGVHVNYSSLEGYLAAKVFTEGLRRTQRSPSQDQMIDALESIQRQDFGGFLVDFGPRDHVASTFVDLSMLTGDGKVRR